MSRALEIAETVEAILADPAPVLMLDTCVLLDVIRAPQRERLDTIVAAKRLLDLVRTTPQSLHVVTQAMVVVEWRDSHDGVRADTEHFVDRIARALADVTSAAQLLGLVCPAASKPGALGIPQRLEDLAVEIMDASTLVLHHQECQLRALDRVTLKRPPAGAAGQVKDSVICEHYLEISRALKHRGFGSPCVFTSSNTRDYCIEKSYLLPGLSTEFTDACLSFASSIGMALGMLGLSRADEGGGLA